MGAATRLERIAERQRNPKWRNAPVRIEMSECINCDACLRHCPPQFGAIFNHGPDVVIVPELCSGCDKCLPACPVNCIYPFPSGRRPARPPSGGACPSPTTTPMSEEDLSEQRGDGMTTSLLSGAEPWSYDAGPIGALCLHGFTGHPGSMRPVAEAFAAAGLSVELPRLPGHGTTVEEMMLTGWPDWSAEAEAVLGRLASRCDKVVVAGLSMGGSLTAWLGTRHPELAGLVLINAVVQPQPNEVLDMVRGMVAEGTTSIPGIGSDIAMPGVKETAYESTPLVPLLSLMDALSLLQDELDRITMPGAGRQQPPGPRGRAVEQRPHRRLRDGDGRATQPGEQLPRGHPRLRRPARLRADGGLREGRDGGRVNPLPSAVAVSVTPC